MTFFLFSIIDLIWQLIKLNPPDPNYRVSYMMIMTQDMSYTYLNAQASLTMQYRDKRLLKNCLTIHE